MIPAIKPLTVRQFFGRKGLLSEWHPGYEYREGQLRMAEAVESARALSRSEGIFCGISSGATFAAALKVAGEAPQGAVILAMLPDTAERYLSTVLFEGIAEGGDPEP